MHKIAIAADLHLNNNPYGKIMEDGLPLKIHDNFNALDFFVEQCIDRKVCKAIIVGDTFDNPAPSSRVRRLLNKRLQKLINNNIEVVVLVGNHDSFMEHHALEPLMGWSNKLKIVENVGYDLCGQNQEVCFVYMPHTKDVENKKTTFKEYIAKFKDVRYTFPHNDKRLIFFGHFGTFGSFLNDLSLNSDSGDVSPKDLENLECEICFLGDYHKRQKISGTKDIWYVGSLERQDFSEKDQEKGFCVYDLEEKSLEWVNYDARKMTVITGNTPLEISSLITEESVSNAIVKITVEDRDGYFEVQQAFNELNSLIRENKAAFFVGLEKPKSKKQVNALSIEGLDSDNIDIYSIVETEIKKASQNESPEEVDARIEFLRQIKKEVNMKNQLFSKPTFSPNRQKL